MLGLDNVEAPDRSRGVEADQCFFFDLDKLAAVARLRGSNDVAGFPNPDLAIEVDLSRPQVDRAAIYEALRVAELWRVELGRVVIERLGADGRYQQVESSGFLPLSADEIWRWVVQEDTSDQTAWDRRLRAWVRSKLGNAVPGVGSGDLRSSVSAGSGDPRRTDLGNAAPGGGGKKDVQNTFEPFSQTGESDA